MKINGLRISNIVWANNRFGNKIEVYRINSASDGAYHEYKATPKRIKLVRAIASQQEMVVKFENEFGEIDQRTSYSSEVFIRQSIYRHSEDITILFRKGYAANDLLTEMTKV